MPIFEEITKSEYDKLWKITYKDIIDIRREVNTKDSYDLTNVLVCRKEEIETEYLDTKSGLIVTNIKYFRVNN